MIIQIDIKYFIWHFNWFFSGLEWHFRIINRRRKYVSILHVNTVYLSKHSNDIKWSHNVYSSKTKCTLHVGYVHLKSFRWKCFCANRYFFMCIIYSSFHCHSYPIVFTASRSHIEPFPFPLTPVHFSSCL